MQKNRLRVPEKNRVLRVMYGGKREKVAGRRHENDRCQTHTTLHSENMKERGDVGGLRANRRVILY
jgi:hypothetical protein